MGEQNYLKLNYLLKFHYILFPIISRPPQLIFANFDTNKSIFLSSALFSYLTVHTFLHLFHKNFQIIHKLYVTRRIFATPVYLKAPGNWENNSLKFFEHFFFHEKHVIAYLRISVFRLGDSLLQFETQAGTHKFTLKHTG